MIFVKIKRVIVKLYKRDYTYYTMSLYYLLLNNTMSVLCEFRVKPILLGILWKLMQ